LVADLKNYLQTKFKSSLEISTFYDGESCLKKITKDTHIVILDYFLDGKNGLEILKMIKTTNPKTEVIMLSNNEDIAIAIETFRAGAKDYVIKSDGYWKKIINLVNGMVTKPIIIIVKGFFR
jgi:two-component system response regulator HydG